MNRGVIYLVIGMILTINWNIQAVCIPGYEDYEQIIPFEILGEEGVLILSNSPETVKETGVLYREKVCGRSRMVFHHVNATGKNDKKLLILNSKIIVSLLKHIICHFKFKINYFFILFLLFAFFMQIFTMNYIFMYFSSIYIY